MSDRGYRDEVGAAVERLEALAEENARLREELDRLDEPKRRALRGRSVRVAMLLLGVFFGATFTSLVSHHFAPQHHRHHRHSVVRPRAQEVEPIRNGDDCSLPYYYDRNHVRRWKPSCLADTPRRGR